MTEGLNFHEPGRSKEEVAATYGISTENIVKLCSNENPYGPSPLAQAAVANEARLLSVYPAGLYEELSAAIGSANGLAPANVVIGPGAESIVRYLAQLFIDPHDEAIMARQSFDAAPWWTLVMNGVVKYVDLNDFCYELEAVSHLVSKRTKIIWLCSPNNPTGTILRRADVHEFLEHIPHRVAVVFDQAYCEFTVDPEYADGVSFLKSGHGNVIVLRTFSKAYGLAGVRLGYALADERICASMEKVHEPFHVSRDAVVAGLAALGDDAWVEDVVGRTIAERSRLTRELAALGLDVVPSEANFVLAKVPQDAELFAERLMEKGIVVRPTSAWGYREHIRITVGTDDENNRLLRAVASLLR